jgi:hypothetical protein
VTAPIMHRLQSASAAASPCRWVILTEVARGLIASKLLPPEAILEFLGRDAREYPGARQWARHVLSTLPAVMRGDVDFALASTTKSSDDLTRRYFDYRLIAELLIEQRHASVTHVRLAFGDMVDTLIVTVTTKMFTCSGPRSVIPSGGLSPRSTPHWAASAFLKREGTPSLGTFSRGLSAGLCLRVPVSPTPSA